MDSRSFAPGDRLFDTLLYVIAAIVVVVTAFPIYFVVIASISDPVLVLNGKVTLWPAGLNTEAYHEVFKNKQVWSGYRNSIMYTTIGTCINLLLTTVAAYSLSRRTLPGRNIFMFIITFTMFFNGGLIPTYLLVKDLHLNNTFWALVIPNAIATYNLIVMRTYFQNSIPDELLEAAQMDGCTNLRTFWSVVLPLSKPILAVMVLFYAVQHWNSYFNALIYLRDSKMFPLQLILRDILIQNKAQLAADSFGSDKSIFLAESIKYALIIVASVPVLVLYPFVQKYFVKGVMIGAIKG
ncbi:carbohydrate ABC transporter permease [Paenibacillus thalictri]|uniref:Carbohydrate ABC transporter permease n=1 Tax=Paenibacillus thalictri TaxID=2527873 RepID=A0A4Q9DIL9_9BACL|nr:carbohydrate ABC transporter permease [Paenibacillus thalictri]TBL73232.1 carbohydrate ABC transporter permease [Paenibacillus thalictri]